MSKMKSHSSASLASSASNADFNRLSDEQSDDSEASSTMISENKELMVPRFLTCDELLGWKLTVAQNAKTKVNTYSYTVTCQTRDHWFPVETTSVLAKCDGPCGVVMPTRKMMLMGKCEHLLCKACYGIVINDDGSFGCSNFDCWAEPTSSFGREKRKYRKVLKHQMSRAKTLKEHGDDVYECSVEALPVTPSHNK